MTSKDEVLSRKIERVQRSIQLFPAASANLNTASDLLGKSIGQLELVLKKFSLGIPTWVEFDAWEHGSAFSHDDIGYAKIGGRWGIAIRTVKGDDHSNEDATAEQWSFNDAPRLFRVNAVEKIPELLEKLLKDAAELTEEIAGRIQEVDLLTASILTVLESPAKPTDAPALTAARLAKTADKKSER